METKYSLLSEERIAAHKRAFVKWINVKLSKVSPSVRVRDLIEDFRDGAALLALAEALTPGQAMTSSRGKPLGCVRRALLTLRQAEVEMSDVMGAAVVSGKEAAILALAWSIIWRFQVMRAPDMRDASSEEVEQALLRWCQGRLESYADNIDPVHDFHMSWRNGVAFNALLLSFRPSLFDLGTIMACDVRTRLSHAFNVAAMEFGLPCYLEPADVDRDEPDATLIMMYVSCLCTSTRGSDSIGTVETNEHTPTWHEHVTRTEPRILQVSGFPNAIRIQETHVFNVSPLPSPTAFQRVCGARERSLMQRRFSDQETQRSSPDASHESLSEPSESEPISPVGAERSPSPAESQYISFASTPLNGNSTAIRPEQTFQDRLGDTFASPCLSDCTTKGRETGSEDTNDSTCSSFTVSQLTSELSSADDDMLMSLVEGSELTPEQFTTSLTLHFNGKNYQRARVDLAEYLENKLDDVDRCLSAKESKLMDTDLDSMDLTAAKQSLDYQQELIAQLVALEPTISSVVGEGRDVVRSERFDSNLASYFEDKMQTVEGRLRALQTKADKEQQRLADIYSILMSQHVERMNDWLLRAEATMSLGDDPEATHDGVRAQVHQHQKFMEDMADHSMVNVIFEMDMEVTLLDENNRAWVRVLSERWAAVWTWAEEWKHTLTQVLGDWERFRREQKVLLNWLTSKEESLGLVGRTDITDPKQVAVGQELLKAVEREMTNQDRRLESLHESAEQLIMHAGYHNFTAKNIRDQVQEFDACWEDVSKRLRTRQEVLNRSSDSLKQIGTNVKRVREWIKVADAALTVMKNSYDIRDDKSRETIEQLCKERDGHEDKVKKVRALSKRLADHVDEPSQEALQRVLGPFYRKWEAVNANLDNVRSAQARESQEECCLVKLLKRNLSIGK